MNIAGKLERQTEAMLAKISEAKQTRTLAPEGWYDGSELRSPEYQAMLGLVLSADPHALLGMMRHVAADPHFEEYLSDDTHPQRVNQLQAELESKYGPQFGVTDLFVVLLGIHQLYSE